MRKNPKNPGYLSGSLPLLIGTRAIKMVASLLKNTKAVANVISASLHKYPLSGLIAMGVERKRKSH